MRGAASRQNRLILAYAAHFTIPGNQKVLHLRARIWKLITLLRTVFVVLKLSGDSLHHARVPDGKQQRTLLPAIAIAARKRLGSTPGAMTNWGNDQLRLGFVGGRGIGRYSMGTATDLLAAPSLATIAIPVRALATDVNVILTTRRNPVINLNFFVPFVFISPAIRFQSWLIGSAI